MNWLYLIIGIILLLAAMLDALWTTFWTEGVAGPLSSRLSRWIWQGWRRIVPRGHWAHSLAGPFILFAIVAMWVGLMWLGWALIFTADSNSLASLIDQSQPNFIGRMYFAAMAVFTMGNGDLYPQGSVWQFTTSLANANGFLSLTLIISYVLSVLPSEVRKRAFAREVAGLGKTGSEFVMAGWNGTDFSELDLPLQFITSRLGQLTEDHLAYPVLDFFQPVEQEASSVVAVAVLEEALALLLYAVPEQSRPSRAVIRATQSSIENFLHTTSSRPVPETSELPPVPQLDLLRQEGVAVAEQAHFEHALERHRGEKRRSLNGNILDAGWRWPLGGNATH